jgi:hypothetical protein
MPASLVFAYYDNAGMLRRHLQEWRRYLPSVQRQLTAIIVDDGTPGVHAADVVKAERGDLAMPVEVYRIDVDKPWNQDGARNLGMLRCPTPWALLMDMDHLLPHHQAETMLRYAERSASGVYYMPNQFLVDGTDLQRPHPNGYLINKSDFWFMGGYDEDFAGWYGSDGNFRKCARGAGLAEVVTNEFHTVVYRRTDIADASTRKYGRKDSPYAATNNPVLAAKRSGPAYRAQNPLRFNWSRVL